MAMIETFSLSRYFGKTAAVEDLTLAVESGEVLGFLGPNGAGKTTTIRMLAGIISPTSGYALVAGQRTDGDVGKLHESIGLLTESPGFYENLSARANLEFYAGFYPGINIHAQVEKYLRMVGLWERRETRVGTYSKGMKQRLALARALVHEPKVLLLDEPSAGLDPEVAHEVRDMIKGLSREGRTIFLSTHNLSEAESLCHRIAVFRTRLLALDTAENLRKRLFRRRLAIQLTSVTPGLVEQMRRLPFVRLAEPEEGRILFELDDSEKNRPELIERIVAAGGRIMSVQEEQHSLEDIYLSLVQEGRDGDAAHR
ncbi:MAG: ABC transporter ATP-binding protein [Chloroflexi bacterium]|nr:ABC transporter ATP-binding protein [Chloroflexota bacterium]